MYGSKQIPTVKKSSRKHKIHSRKKILRINFFFFKFSKLDFLGCASSAGGMGSIPGQGTKIPHVARLHQRKEKEQGNKNPQNFNVLK